MARCLRFPIEPFVGRRAGCGRDRRHRRRVCAEPSQAQLNALRSSCRSDYMAHCSSVPTGGAPALNCLKQHMSALSGGCQSAVNAISPAALPAGPRSNAPASAPAAAPVAPPPASKPRPLLRRLLQRLLPPRASRAGPSARRRLQPSARPAAPTIACIARAFRRAAGRRSPALSATPGHCRVAVCRHRQRARRRGRAGCCACRCRSRRTRRAAAADGAGAAAGNAARRAVHHPQRLRRRFCGLLRRPSFRSRPHRGLPALQQEQPVAALPAGADCAARGPVGLGRQV